MGDMIDREALEEAHPDIRRKDAFLSFKAQMDFDIAEKFLTGEDEDSHGEKLDPNVYYKTGRVTALHMAALNDDAKGIELLLRYGADKEFGSEDGHTALAIAVEGGCERAIALL